MRWIFAGLILLLAIAGGWIGYTLYDASQPAEGPYGVPFELTDQNGDTITDAAFRGHPSAIFFGYTNCPDVCPTTLYELDGWLNKLGAKGENIAAYFVTVDPERDTPEVVGNYVAAVSNRIVGISGAPEKVEAMARGYNVYFKRIDGEDGDYSMDHTASIFLLDSKGRFRKTIAYGESPESAIRKLEDLSGT